MASDRIPEKQEVVAYFNERIEHYQGLKKMFLAGGLNAYRDKKGNLIYKPRGGSPVNHQSSERTQTPGETANE